MEQRTILFRGKKKDGGEWVEGVYLQVKQGGFICVWGADLGSICDDGGEGYLIPFEDMHEIDPATVGQFTGKEDKNGKKVFTGHRVKVHGHEYNVIFNERMTSFDIATTGNGIGFYNSKDIEITGTIHDK